MIDPIGKTDNPHGSAAGPGTKGPLAPAGVGPISAGLPMEEEAAL